MAEHILKGPPRRYREIDISIGECFLNQAERLGDKVFQIDADSGKEETFKEVKRRSVRLAIYLQKIGVKPKDKVLVCCKNNLDNIIPVLAALYLGAYVASVDEKKSAYELKNTLILLEPEVIVCETSALDLIEKSTEQANQTPHIIAIGNTLGKYQNMWDIEKDGRGENDFHPAKISGTDIAVIIFTSGTTSIPKGICLTHWSLINGAQAINQHNELEIDVILHFPPLIWITAWASTVDCIISGKTKVIGPNIGAEQLLKLIEKYQVNFIICSTTYTYQITDLDETIANKYDTSSLHLLGLAGSTIDPEQILKVRKYLPHTNVVLGYGSSETNIISLHAVANQKAIKEKISSSGTPVTGVEIKIVDQETGKTLGPNQKGEILVKSSYMMKDYYKLSKPAKFNENGFFSVGDLGYYDEDGYIYVIDRIDEMFKFRSYYVSPGLLQNVLLQHPAVTEAFVFGIPDAVDMTHPAACVVIKSGETVTPEELVNFVKPIVSDAYQLRGGVMILKSIPKTSTGKYKSRTIKDMFMKPKDTDRNLHNYKFTVK